MKMFSKQLLKLNQCKTDQLIYIQIQLIISREIRLISAREGVSESAISSAASTLVMVDQKK